MLKIVRTVSRRIQRQFGFDPVGTIIHLILL
jgi:hypothetical protein